MSGGTDFQSLVASITSAMTIARVLINADKAFDQGELKLKLADLMVALAEARTQVSEMQDETYRLADELSETRKKLAFAGTMNFEAPYYMSFTDGKRDGPYCATCWDGREKLAIRLYEWSPGSWICNTCRNQVQAATDE